MSPDSGTSRIAGAAPSLVAVLNEWARAEDIRSELGRGSISGSTARTPQPEAMMARGARVTGSGATAATRQQPGFDENRHAVAIFADVRDLVIEPFL